MHRAGQVELSIAASLPAAWEAEAHTSARAAQPQPSPSAAQPATALWAPAREVRWALGAGRVPPALEAAVSSMRPGERAAVWCSPACALRPSAALPQLPASAPDGVEYTLTLTSMLQVRDLHGDGSLLKRRTHPGRGDFPVDCPIHDCVVRVHVATYAAPSTPDGARTLLSDTRAPGGDEEGGCAAEFELATGAQPPGLEAALRLMLPGERAHVRAAARHAYDATPPGRWSRPHGLPEGAAVEWEVTLLGFARPVNWYQASTEDILAEARAAKDAGVALYKSGKWALARARFEALAAKLSGLRGLEGEEEEAAAALRCACLLNAAAAAQKLGDHADAVARCTEVLTKLDASAPKAHFRRAVSRIALGDWCGAEEDLAATREADPAAAADCDRQAAKLKAAQRDALAAARAQLGGFLGRAAAPPDAASPLPQSDDKAA
jgi:hypothetical protein